MKRQLFVECACVVTMVLVAPAVHGDIYTTGDWQEATSGGGIWTGGNSEFVMTMAVADSDNPSNYGGCDGWTKTYTTEAGTFSWYSYLYGKAQGQVSLWDDLTVSCRAWGIASASGPYSSANVTKMINSGPYSGSGGREFPFLSESDPNGTYAESLNVPFTTMDYVQTECYAVVDVYRHSGAWGQDEAYALAMAIAYTDMW